MSPTNAFFLEVMVNNVDVCFILCRGVSPGYDNQQHAQSCEYIMGWMWRQMINCCTDKLVCVTCCLSRTINKFSNTGKHNVRLRYYFMLIDRMEMQLKELILNLRLSKTIGDVWGLLP